MTSPTTNTVTDELAIQLREMAAAYISNDLSVAQINLLRAAAAALSTHPHTGMEDRATAREDTIERVAKAICCPSGECDATKRNAEEGGKYITQHVCCASTLRHEARAAIEAYQASEAQRLPHPHTGGREAVIEECARICERNRSAFGSTEYATGQPLSSFGERFACTTCAADIRALASPPLQKTQKETT